MIHTVFKKLFVFLKSMKFGIALLFMIMAVSMIGTVIPQGLDEHFYSSNYSAATAKLILLLDLNNIYNSIVFLAMFVMLVINLSLCSIFRMKKIIKKVKITPTTETMNLVETINIESHDSINSTIDNTLKKHGFNKCSQVEKTGMHCLTKNKAGFFGSWFLHFGILLVIVFYTYGNITYFSEGVYGVPGTVQSIEGTAYKVKINDFNIEYGSDGAVQQYNSNIELIDDTGKSLISSQVAVNEPMRFEGYSFYQTGYGWTANCNVSKAGDNIVQETVYEQTSLNLSEENIAIYFNRFYPDFAASSGSLFSLSDKLNNPVVLYTVLYMGNVVKMDIAPINEVIKWNEYEFVFHSPSRYTYLEVNKMNGQLGAALGALLIICGLILTFYFKPSRVMIYIEDGKLYVFKDSVLKKSDNTSCRKEKDIYA